MWMCVGEGFSREISRFFSENLKSNRMPRHFEFFSFYESIATSSTYGNCFELTKKTKFKNLNFHKVNFELR